MTDDWKDVVLQKTEKNPSSTFHIFKDSNNITVYCSHWLRARTYLSALVIS